MIEQGVPAYDRARRKAAERAGIGNKRDWPSNEEIQEALLQQRRLFQGERQEEDLRRLREHALMAMRFFADFAPRLVGPVLAGSGGRDQGVCLHLFTDNPEDLVFSLLEQRIPWREREVVLRYGDGACRTHPVFAFFAGETPFALVVLPLGAQRNPPLDPVSERPERGVGVTEVEALIGGAS